MGVTIRILGLDPGLSAMGWGVIDVEGSRLAHVAHGVIVTKPALGLGARLLLLKSPERREERWPPSIEVFFIFSTFLFFSHHSPAARARHL